MVRKIALTQGQHALVDNQDFDLLNQWNWHLKGGNSTKYAHTNIKRPDTGKYTTILMHRIILKAKQGEHVDHINGNGLDNTKKNLRIVTHRQNMQNRQYPTTSRYPGVYWNKGRNVWQGYIVIPNKKGHKYLGAFASEREAAKAYEKACRELVGEELVCKTKGVV